MEQLGHLLHQHRTPDEAAAFQAAAIVSVVNDALKRFIQLDDESIQAVSYRQGDIVIHVTHPAIAGLIMQHEQEILRDVSRTIARRSNRPVRIGRLVCRTT